MPGGQHQVRSELLFLRRDVVLPEHVSGQRHHGIRVPAGGGHVQPGLFVVEPLEKLQRHPFQQSQGVGSGAGMGGERDLPLRGRLSAVDGGVPQQPASIPGVTPPLDHRLPAVGCRNQDRRRRELRQHQVNWHLPRPVVVPRLQAGQVLGQIHSRGRRGKVIRQQVGGPIGTTPVSRGVTPARQIDPRCAIRVAIDEHEPPIAIFRVQILEAVLPNRQSQSPPNPLPARVDLPGVKENLVGQIKPGQVRGLPPQVPMIAHQQQVGRFQSPLGGERRGHLTHQLVGPGDGPPGAAKLTPALLVTDRVGLGEPDHGDQPVLRQQVPQGVVRVGIIDVAPRLLGLQVGQAAGQAAGPEAGRRLRHHGQNACRPVRSPRLQMIVQRRGLAAAIRPPLLCGIIPLQRGDQPRLPVMQQPVHSPRGQLPGTASRSHRFQERIAPQAMPTEPDLPLQPMPIGETAGPHGPVRRDGVGGEGGERVDQVSPPVHEVPRDVGNVPHRRQLFDHVGTQPIDIEHHRPTAGSRPPASQPDRDLGPIVQRTHLLRPAHLGDERPGVGSGLSVVDAQVESPSMRDHQAARRPHKERAARANPRDEAKAGSRPHPRGGERELFPDQAVGVVKGSLRADRPLDAVGPLGTKPRNLQLPTGDHRQCFARRDVEPGIGPGGVPGYHDSAE